MPPEDQLYAVCRKHPFMHRPGCLVVLPEPYIPYLPPRATGEAWNGVLLLAEAQRMGEREKVYVDRIKHASQQDRWDRLNLSYADFPEALHRTQAGVHQDVALAPWKSGVLPFVVAAIAELTDRGREVLSTCEGLRAIGQVAVSNAVPWSCTSGDGKKAMPPVVGRTWSPDAESAVAFWTDLLPAMELEYELVREVWTIGQVAREVMSAARTPVSLCMPMPGFYTLPRLQEEAEALRDSRPEVCERLEAQLSDLGPQLGIGARDHELARCSAAAAVKQYLGL